MNRSGTGTVSLIRLARVAALIALAAATASCALVESLVAEPEPDPQVEGAGEPRTPDTGPDTERDEPQAPETPDPDRSDAEPDEAVDDPPSPPAIEWRTLASGDQSAVRVPVAQPVAEPGLWRDFWAALTANRIDPPEPPAVDFSSETVVVLILGERPTGGYAVRIADLVVRREEVLVVVDVVRPDPDAIVTQALTTPYFIAAVPFTDRAFVFTGDSVEAGFHGD